MIRDFIAIDFETANQESSSVCSIGVVMVRNGQVADSFYSLIQPLADNSATRYPITSFTLLQPLVVTTCRTIIMHWLMPKPVQL